MKFLSMNQKNRLIKSMSSNSNIRSYNTGMNGSPDILYTAESQGHSEVYSGYQVNYNKTAYALATSI